MASRKPKTSPSPTYKAEKKRVEILKAAGKCFRKTGFHQTSMQEICAEIGLGPGAVYRYFTGKEAIIEAMAEDERRQARAILSQLQEAHHLPEALANVSQAFTERYAAASDASLMAEVYAEGLRNKRVGAIIKKTETEWVNGLADLLRTAQARGQVDPALDSRHTALMLTAIWDGLVIRQAYDTEGKPQSLLAFFDAMVKRMLVRDGKTEKRAKIPPIVVPAITDLLVDEADIRADIGLEHDTRQLSLI